MRWRGLLAAGPLLAGGCSGEETADPVTVYAAASLIDAVREIATAHERETGARISLNFAGSSTLARQIEAGAPADVFLSANPEWLEHLEAADRIEPGTRFDWAGNSLALVVPAASTGEVDSETFFASFDGRLALGDPSHVPAGIYAREALVSAEWWGTVESRVVATADVRAALALVERGECEAGVVYRTDAEASEKVRIVFRIPDEWHRPIRYPGAVLRGRSRPAVDGFVAALRSDDSIAVLKRHGFRAPIGKGPP